MASRSDTRIFVVGLPAEVGIDEVKTFIREGVNITPKSVFKAPDDSLGIQLTSGEEVEKVGKFFGLVLGF